MKQASDTHPITIRVSTEMFNDIDSYIPDRRRVCRERFVMDAVEAYLGHPEKAVYGTPNSRLGTRTGEARK